MSKTTIKLKKALTVANIQNQVIERIPFEGDWFQAFGKPQNRGAWFVWGGSGSGKSTFLLMLAKVLSFFYKTCYNLLEEETDDSDYIDRSELCKMNEVEDNFSTVSYNLEELDYYLSKRNSPHVVIIDSLPYFTKSFDEYLEFKNKWATKKILIFAGHAEGKNPRTEMQKDVMHNCKMKIYVSGYLAICKGRTIGPNGGEYIIWKEGFDKLRGAS